MADFIPALRFHALTRLYDPVVRATARARAVKRVLALRSLVTLLALLLVLPAAVANAPRQNFGADRADAQLQRAMERVREGRLGDALGELDRIIARYPNFRLAHLMLGDLLLARVRDLDHFGMAGGPLETCS